MIYLSNNIKHFVFFGITIRCITDVSTQLLNGYD
jgi:hypothetical protein